MIATSWIAAPAEKPVVRAIRMAFLLTLIAILFRDPMAPEWLWKLREAK